MCCAGMGKANAAATTQVLITKFGAEKIIFSGIAGNMTSKIGIGDVVIGKTVLYHDAQLDMICQNPPFLKEYSGDPELIAAAEAACAEAGVKALVGKIATGDLFVGDSETKAAIEAKCAPDCVEMEGAAVSQIAAKNGVPCVILRAMSDNADEDGHEVLVVKKFSIGEYVATATKIVAAMVESCKLPQNNNSQTGSAGLAVLCLCQFLVRSLVYRARVALSTAMTITPTSAKMAAHIPAMPVHPAAGTALDAQRKHDVLVHDAQGAAGDAHGKRDFGGVVIHQHHICGLDGGVRTSAPMAMPTSARDSTGASLIPSPTKARFSLGCFAASSFSIWSTLSPGKRPAWYSSRPSCCATACATGCASPVSMTVLRTPEAFKARMASALWGFTTSEISR